MNITRGTAVLLFGGGGHAASVAAAIARLGAQLVAVAAPHVSLSGIQIFHDDGTAATAAISEGWHVVAAIGDGAKRIGLVQQLRAQGCRLGTVVAATSTVDAERLGAATVVLEHAHVGSRASVGESVIVNTGAAVEHDVRLGDATHVAPNAVVGGGATIGAQVLVGSGAVVLPRLSVGDGAHIGAGAVVTSDVSAGATVVGAPAKPISGQRPTSP